MFPQSPGLGYFEFDGAGAISDMSAFNYHGGWYTVDQNESSDATYFGAIESLNLELSGKAEIWHIIKSVLFAFSILESIDLDESASAISL